VSHVHVVLTTKETLFLVHIVEESFATCSLREKLVYIRARLEARKSISLWSYSIDKTTIFAEVTLLTNMALYIFSYHNLSRIGDFITTTAP
jgi:hypothetical protein